MFFPPPCFCKLCTARRNLWHEIRQMLGICWVFWEVNKWFNALKTGYLAPHCNNANVHWFGLWDLLPGRCFMLCTWWNIENSIHYCTNLRAEVILYIIDNQLRLCCHCHHITGTYQMEAGVPSGRDAVIFRFHKILECSVFLPIGLNSHWKNQHLTYITRVNHQQNYPQT